MFCAVDRFSVLGSIYGPAVAPGLLALDIFDIDVAQRFTVLFATARFPTCETVLGLLVTPHRLTTLGLHVVEAALLTMRPTVLGLPAGRTMRGMLLTPDDLAAFVLDIDVALGRVFLAVYTFPTRLAIVRFLIAARILTGFRHISALIIRHGVFPDILRSHPEKN